MWKQLSPLAREPHLKLLAMSYNSLTTSIYTIRSAIETRPYVSRNLHEELSLNPKRIASQPKDLQPDPERVNVGPYLFVTNTSEIRLLPQWIIEKVSDDRYLLRSIGSPTAVIDGKVFAILMCVPPAQEWKLQSIPQHGENQYL